MARSYWENCGREMLDRDFPDIKDKIAVGLCGSGSECLGYDDEVSRDHDFEPGFCLFLPGEEEVDRRTAFRLERAYAALPKEWMGFRRAFLSPVGGNRHGVIRFPDFLLEKTGTTDGELSVNRWLSVPEQNLLEVVSGEIWQDPSGIFSKIRDNLSSPPEDIRLRKLSGELLLMSQSGQYNYRRCLDHGEPGAAMLSAGEFVKAALHAFLLLDRKYMPYYKWAFRALKERGSRRRQQAEKLEAVLLGGIDDESALDREVAIADIAQDMAEELISLNLTEASCCDLEQHAHSVADRIKDPEIRNMHILSGVS